MFKGKNYRFLNTYLNYYSDFLNVQRNKLLIPKHLLNYYSRGMYIVHSQVCLLAVTQRLLQSNREKTFGDPVHEHRLGERWIKWACYTAICITYNCR